MTKTWIVTASVSAGKHIGEFEAETANEAFEKAYEHERAYCSVCHQCADDVEDPQITEFNAYCSETGESVSDGRNFYEEITALKAEIAELKSRLKETP